MSLRVVLIASTKAEGRDFASEMHSDRVAVAIVTPRSPYAARGINADEVWRTPAMHSHPRIAELLAAVKPCMATSNWRREFLGEWLASEPQDSGSR